MLNANKKLVCTRVKFLQQGKITIVFVVGGKAGVFLLFYRHNASAEVLQQQKKFSENFGVPFTVKIPREVSLIQRKNPNEQVSSCPKPDYLTRRQRRIDCQHFT